MNTSPIKYSLLLFCLSLAFSLTGQKQNKSGNFRGYTHSGASVGGYFHHADSTGIYYATTKSALQDLRQLKRMPLQETHRIMVRRKGAVVKGALFGLLVGTITGPIIGSAISTSGKDYTTSPFGGLDYTFDSLDGIGTGLIVGPLVGVITGALIGKGKRQFIFRGKVSRLQEQERKLKKFAYRNR
jgi:hypothetical protein